MAPVPDNAQIASDAELITRVRAGDRGAFGDLYVRHAGAAAGLARQFARSVAEADDLVSESFARVLDGMLEGKGPDTAFRAYLFTTLRHTAYDRTRKDRRLQFTDDIESHDVAVQGDDPVIADLESGFIGKAFAGLPERWQTVLWHLQVEGQSAAEVGLLLGMAPNAVSSLAFRAREGLREAYLQAHLADSAAQRCRTTVDRLGAWTRGGLSKREKAQVDAHLQECDRCPALAAELSEVNSGLRGLLAPLLLGGAAAGYIATLGPVEPLAQLGALTGGSAVGGQPTSGQTAFVGSTKFGGHAARAGASGPWAVVAGAVTVAAVVVAGIVFALANSGHAPDTAAKPGSVASTVVTNGGGSEAGGGSGAGGSGTVGSGAGNPGGAASPGGSGGAANPGGGSGAGNQAGSGNGNGGNVPGTGGGSNGTSTGGAGTAAGAANGSGNSVGGLSTNGTNSATGQGAGGAGQGSPGAGGLNTTGTGAGSPGPGGTNSSGGIPGAGFPGSAGISTLPIFPGVLPLSTPSAPSVVPPTNGSPVTAPLSPTTPTTPSTPTTNGQSLPVITIPTVPNLPSRPPATTPTPPTSSIATTPKPPSSVTPPVTPPVIPPPSTAPTNPPPPAPTVQVYLQANASLSAGQSGAALRLTLTNKSGSVIPAGASLGVTTPPGLSVTAVSPAQGSGLGLRASTTSSAFAGIPGEHACTILGQVSTCRLPLALPKDLAVTVILSADVQTSDPTLAGQLAVSLDGKPLGTVKISLAIATGFQSISFTSPAEAKPPASVPAGLALGSLSRTRLVATAKKNVNTSLLGELTLPVDLGNGLTVETLETPGCAPDLQATPRTFTCEAAAVLAGVVLEVRVAPTATTIDGAATPLALHIVDEQKRPVPLSGALNVAKNGGYGPPVLAGSEALHVGTTVDAITVSLPRLDDNVLNAGPVQIPATLGHGVSVTSVATGDTGTCSVEVGGYFTCTPKDENPLVVRLTVFVDPLLAGGALDTLTLPMPGVGTPLSVSLKSVVVVNSGGYASISAGTSGLVAGTTRVLTLVGKPVASVADPGVVSLRNDLGSGVSIVGVSPTSAAECDVGEVLTQCRPLALGRVTTWRLIIKVATMVEPGKITSPTVTLPNKVSLTTVAGPGTDFTIYPAPSSCGTPATLDNPDFERPSVTDGGGKFVRNGTAGLGWRTTAKDGFIEFWRRTAPPAHSGVQFVELNANYVGALYQDVVTVPGQVMHWSIWHRGRAWPKSSGIDTMEVQIGVPGDVLVPDVPDHPTNLQHPSWISDGSGAWAQHTGTYVVPAGQTRTRFQFAAVSTASGSETIGNFLDDITFSTTPCLTATTTITTGATGGQAVHPGDTLHVRTDVRNVGGDAASVVVVQTAVPASTTYVPGSRREASTDLEAGSSTELSFDVRVDADVPDGSLITAGAAVTYRWNLVPSSLHSYSAAAVIEVSAGGG